MSSVALRKTAVQEVTAQQATLRRTASLIRVVIVDDHEILAEGLVRLLADDPGISVIGRELTARAGVERATNEHPDVVIMDYSGSSTSYVATPFVPVCRLQGPWHSQISKILWPSRGSKWVARYVV